MTAMEFLHLIEVGSAVLTPLISAVSAMLSLVNRGKIQEVKIMMNGRMEDLLREARDAAHSRGEIIGRDSAVNTAAEVVKAAAEVADQVAAKAAVVAAEVAAKAAVSVVVTTRAAEETPPDQSP